MVAFDLLEQQGVDVHLLISSAYIVYPWGAVLSVNEILA